MRLAAALPAVLLLCGCGTAPFGSSAPPAQLASLQLTAQPSTVAAGTASTLSLYNGAAEPIGQNLCFASLEQLRGGLWVPAVSVAKGCPDELYPLEPGQQTSAASQLPATAETGEYRFVTRVHAPLGSVLPKQVRSDSITIVGGLRD